MFFPWTISTGSFISSSGSGTWQSYHGPASFSALEFSQLPRGLNWKFSKIFQFLKPVTLQVDPYLHFHWASKAEQQTGNWSDHEEDLVRRLVHPDAALQEHAARWLPTTTITHWTSLILYSTYRYLQSLGDRPLRQVIYTNPWSNYQIKWYLIQVLPKDRRWWKGIHQHAHQSVLDSNFMPSFF